MPRKMKFRPVVTRVELSPEQAVLACACYSSGHVINTAGHGTSGSACVYATKTTQNGYYDGDATST